VWVTVSVEVIKVTVGEEKLISAAKGNGPVNAFDPRAAQDLGKCQSMSKSSNLTDYCVRIRNADTKPVARALIESEDENRRALHHDCGVAQYH